MDNHFGQQPQVEPPRSAPVQTSTTYNNRNSQQESQLQLVLPHSLDVRQSNPTISPHIPTTSQFNPLAASMKEKVDESYAWLVKSFHETTEHNRHLNKLLQTKDAGLKIFHENELHLRAELSSFQQRHKALEHDYYNLRSELLSLKTHSVPKAQLDEVVDHNKKITENNANLSEQIEILLKETSGQQQMLSKLRTENGNLFGDSLTLRQENVELNEKVSKLEEALSTGCSLKVEVEEVHDKLSKASAQILVVNSKVKILQDENQSLRLQVQNLNGEREKLQLEQKHIATKNQEEVSKLKEKLNQRRSELQTRDDSFQKLLKEVEDLKQLFDSKRQEQAQLREQLESENECARLANLNVFEHSKTIEVLRKDLEDQNTQSERKSNFISALKKLLKKTEDELKDTVAGAEELRAQMKSLKTENDHLRAQINHKIDEIRNLKPHPTLLQNENKNKSYSGQIEELQLANNVLKKQLDENTLHLKSLEEELKKQKLVMGLQKTILDASDAKSKEMEEEIKGKRAKLEEQKGLIKSQSVRIKTLVSQLKDRDVEVQNLRGQLDEEIKHGQIVEEQNQSQLEELEKQHKSQMEIQDELGQLHVKVNDLEESLGKYKAENIQHRDLLNRALAEKSQLKTKLRACNCPSLAKKIGDLKQLLQKHVATIQEAEEKISGLRSHVSSLQKEGDEKREVIRGLRLDLNNSELSFNKICYELRTVRNENKRRETSPSDHFHVEEIISSDDDVRPAKKTRKSDDKDDGERHKGNKKIRAENESGRNDGSRVRYIAKKKSSRTTRKPISYP